MRILGFLCASLVLLGSGAVACGGSNDGEQEDASVTADRWIELLGHVPHAGDDSILIRLNDYARAREALGAARPSKDASEEELVEYLEAVAAKEGESTGLKPIDLYGFTTFPVELRGLGDELGFTFAHVDQDLQVGVGEDSYQVLSGDLDAATMRAAVQSDPVFRDLLEEHEYQGTSYYSWGEDHDIDSERKSPSRPLGQSARLALVDGVVSWTGWTEGIEAMIDAGADTRPSLADSETFRLLAQGMFDLEAYSAMLTPQTFSATNFARQLLGIGGSPEREQLVLDEIKSYRLLLPYQATGVGVGAEGDQLYLAIVLLHVDEATAAENVEHLSDRINSEGVLSLSNEPLSELYSDMEISSDGRLLKAKLFPYRLPSEISILTGLDGLLLYDDTDE